MSGCEVERVDHGLAFLFTKYANVFFSLFFHTRQSFFAFVILNLSLPSNLSDSSCHYDHDLFSSFPDRFFIPPCLSSLPLPPPLVKVLVKVFALAGCSFSRNKRLSRGQRNNIPSLLCNKKDEQPNKKRIITDKPYTATRS